ncbi:MAG TPA: iron-containing redox enzyme family protein [Chloroflexia bacterium]
MRRQALDEIIDEKCLLKHPFYKAWNEGALRVEDIALYATQYGEFIDRIADGWEAAGDSAVAAEEREHSALWTDFATGLNATRPAERRLPEIEELVTLSNDMFRTRPQALGALYAFEQQQPGTAQTKLEGLRRHYSLPAASEVYFDVHKSDEAEPRWLAEQMELLPAEDFRLAEDACRRMSVALWRALDGVMDARTVAVG